MKTTTNLCAAAVMAFITVAGDAWAFNRNLSGAWTAPDGDVWVIVHLGSSATFSTTIYNEDVGQISFNFSGYVSGGGDEDSFRYSGQGEPVRIRIEDVSCVIESSMRAGGYVSGEVGGRIIRMRSCTVNFAATCRGSNNVIMDSYNCSGTWR